MIMPCFDHVVEPVEAIVVAMDCFAVVVDFSWAIAAVATKAVSRLRHAVLLTPPLGRRSDATVVNTTSGVGTMTRRRAKRQRNASMSNSSDSDFDSTAAGGAKKLMLMMAGRACVAIVARPGSRWEQSCGLLLPLTVFSWQSSYRQPSSIPPNNCHYWPVGGWPPPC
jgi:hypothetical protein